MKCCLRVFLGWFIPRHRLNIHRSVRVLTLQGRFRCRLKPIRTINRHRGITIYRFCFFSKEPQDHKRFFFIIIISKIIWKCRKMVLKVARYIYRLLYRLEIHCLMKISKSIYWFVPIFRYNRILNVYCISLSFKMWMLS